MKTKEEIKAYQKEYRQRPEVKKRRKEYLQRPEVKKRKREQARVYRKNNLEKLREWWKGYRKKEKYKITKKKSYEKNKENNKEKERRRAKEHRKKYSKKVRGYFNIYAEKKRKTDKNYNVRNRLRCLFCAALRYYTKTGKYKKSDEYGVNYKAIIEYLKPFPEDISLYHIDHRKPLCSFNLTNPEEIKKAFAPENHQWLLAEENLSKGKKLITNVIN